MKNKKIKIEVESVTLLEHNGTDIIYFDLVGTPSSFPELKYKPQFKAEARKGYGREWLIKSFNIEPTKIITIE